MLGRGFLQTQHHSLISDFAGMYTCSRSSRGEWGPSGSSHIPPTRKESTEALEGGPFTSQN